jgi:hypothetical protein
MGCTEYTTDHAQLWNTATLTHRHETHRQSACALYMSSGRQLQCSSAAFVDAETLCWSKPVAHGCFKAPSCFITCWLFEWTLDFTTKPHAQAASLAH